MKESVITLLHVDYSRFLLQLRDMNPSISYPGYWGAFGGEIETRETPEKAACRELKEELGYVLERVYYFRDYYLDINSANNWDVHLHVFYGDLMIPIKNMHLTEGLDFGLFSLTDIDCGNLYSEKLRRTFPVVELLVDIFKEFSEHVALNISKTGN